MRAAAAIWSRSLCSGFSPRWCASNYAYKPSLHSSAKLDAWQETVVPERSSELLSVVQDVFSMGCVIAELYLEGKALFDLSKVSP